LGKPVWILLTHAPDWRWLLDRDDSPWYPSARLFRQRETRDWSSATMRVREALLEFTENPALETEHGDEREFRRQPNAAPNLIAGTVRP
jgi:hypothetical protein